MSWFFYHFGLQTHTHLDLKYISGISVLQVLQLSGVDENMANEIEHVLVNGKDTSIIYY